MEDDDPVDNWEPPVRQSLRVARSSDAQWKSRYLGWFLILAALLFFTYWHFSIPPPGKAVAALAVAAAIMSLRPEATGLERSGWMLVLCAFLFVELRAIDKDRADVAERQSKYRKEEQTNFSKVMEGNQKSFEATVSKLEMLTNLSKENIDTVTGGDSFPTFEALQPIASAKELQLVAMAHGKHDIVGCTMSVIQHTQDLLKDPDELMQQLFFRDPKFVPLIPLNVITNVPFKISPRGPKDNFDIEATCRNGLFKEHLALTPRGVLWDEAWEAVNASGKVLDQQPRAKHSSR